MLATSILLKPLNAEGQEIEPELTFGGSALTKYVIDLIEVLYDYDLISPPSVSSIHLNAELNLVHLTWLQCWNLNPMLLESSDSVAIHCQHIKLCLQKYLRAVS